MPTRTFRCVPGHDQHVTMRNRLTTGPPTPPSPCCEWSVRVRVPSVPSKSSRGTSSTTNMHTEVELSQPTTRNVKTVQRNDHMGLSSFALLCLAQLRWVQHLAWNPDATPDPRTPQKHPYVLAPMYLLASPHQRTQLSPTCCTMHRYVFKQSMQTWRESEGAKRAEQVKSWDVFDNKHAHGG